MKIFFKQAKITGFLVGLVLAVASPVAFAETPGTGIPPSSGTGIPVSPGTGIPPSSGTGIPVAGGTGIAISKTLENPLGDVKTFNDLVAKVLRALVSVMMPFVVLGFIWTGFMFVRAQGAPKELENAKRSLWYTIVGAFILLGAWGFAQIIGTTVAGITGVK